MIKIQLTDRQLKIIEIVKQSGPITSEQIATMLSVTRATLRPDLAILTMSGILDARPKVGYFYVGIDENNLIAKKLRSKKVEDLMSLPVVVGEEATVYDTIVTIFLEDTGSVFVTDGGFLTGVVSRKDLLKNAIGGIDINKIPVGIIMTRMPNIIMAFPDESISDVARKIIEHEVDSVPVVEHVRREDGKEGYKILGKISKTNIARFFVELAGE
ncbi:MAG: CBS domain-containing protein [Peptoclostridium sp.]|uniref:helix-turn-helix transcriptional regulator n=1 Tax=Peptoclostridium sp. TaxID=1904860 RepID=UPI00139DF1F0|nr:helix-turn-helix transcriptional regulator [Peptoclostridium sp.]MZQ75067.1 CBS domain-containing protein [Peptoclostridium sp.]